MSAAVTPRATKLIHHADRIAGRYVVVLEGAPAVRLGHTAVPSDDGTIDRVAQRYNAKVERRFGLALHGFAARMSDSDAAALAADPAVAFVEDVIPVHASATETGVDWGLDRIDQQAMPLDGNYTYTSDGTGVTAFIIDTGIDTTHVEFTGRVASGATAIDDGNGVEDCNGHGTHVSGTVGGTVYGVAKKVTLVPVRVLGCDGSGSSDGVIAGMDWVAQHHSGPSVANMSLGGGASDAEDMAARNLVASGVVLAVAAGNDSVDACQQSPAREPMAITVAASNISESRASYSNYGSCVDLFAPGTDITSAWNDSDTGTNTISGTSMATPHVVGAAALYLSQNPSATPAQVAAVLLASATPDRLANANGTPNKLLYTTFTNAPPPNGNLRITSPANGATVQAMFSVTVDATGASSVELLVDGTSLVVDNSAPFAFTVTNAPSGQHEVKVVATDASGTKTQTSITVTVAGGGDGTFPGNNPLPPTKRRGCSAAGGADGFGMLFAIVGMVWRRRRRIGQRRADKTFSSSASMVGIVSSWRASAQLSPPSTHVTDVVVTADDAER